MHPRCARRSGRRSPARAFGFQSFVSTRTRRAGSVAPRCSVSVLARCARKDAPNLILCTTIRCTVPGPLHHARPARGLIHPTLSGATDRILCSAENDTPVLARVPPGGHSSPIAAHPDMGIWWPSLCGHSGPRSARSLERLVVGPLWSLRSILRLSKRALGGRAFVVTPVPCSARSLKRLVVGPFVVTPVRPPPAQGRLVVGPSWLRQFVLRLPQKGVWWSGRCDHGGPGFRPPAKALGRRACVVTPIRPPPAKGHLVVEPL